MELQISGTPESYVVVYDAAAAGFRTWPFALAGLIFVAVGVGVFFNCRNSIRPRERIEARLAALFMGIVGSFWTITLFNELLSDYRHLTDALQTHRYVVVEGAVSDFVPEGADGHRAETWQVSGHHYRVSWSEVTNGFGRPGRVRAGEYVRIADVDGTIARIERRVTAPRDHAP